MTSAALDRSVHTDKRPLSETVREAFFVIIVAVPLMGTFFPYESYLTAPTLANPLGTPVPPGIVTTLTLTALYFVIAILYAQNSTKIISCAARNWFLLAFAGWAIVTCLWAEVPALSFNRSGRLLLSVLYAIYFARILNRKDFFRVLFFAGMIAILGSVAVTVIYPNLSRVVDLRGAYRGAFLHKNLLGSVAAISIVLSIYSYVNRLTPRWMSVSLLLMAMAMIILSNSVTSILALAAAGTLILYLRWFASGTQETRVFALLLALTGMSFLYFASDLLVSGLELAGRDATLTGRTDVWQFARTMIDIKPFWGWGHGAWVMPFFSKVVVQELKWPAPHAHNAWLDFRLQLGLPGLVLAVICAFLGIKRGLANALKSSDGESLVWIAIILFQGLRSTTETMFVDPASLEMFWFALAVIRLDMLDARLPLSHAAVQRVPVKAHDYARM